ncbi:MAG: HD domain-containing phosphohydrolase [Pseudomonadota bacterium]
MPRTRLRERRFPLHMHISALFTLLLLFTGVLLGLFNYRQTSAIILSSSEALFSRIQQDVQRDLQSTYKPIRQVLSLLVLHEAVQTRSLEARLRLLEPFVQALRDNPKLASLYLGYENGDFFMVRPLRSDALKAAFAAPAQAAYQVWSIERSGNAFATQHLFFDAALGLLERRPQLEESFDPRGRAWYLNARDEAGDGAITTAPYVFFSSREVGTTLAHRAGSSAVLAADLTLADLSATLAGHKVTPSTEVLLFEPSGNAVAYPDSTGLVVHGDSLQLAKARDLSAPLAAWLDQAQPGQQAGSLTLDNTRRWVVALTHLPEGGPQGLNLALLVPEDELLADAYRLRWQGALVTLTLLLLSLPLGWLASRLIVKPLRALVNEAEAIGRFQFNHPANGRSPVLEVDQLAVAMARMKETLGSFLEITVSLSAESRFDALLKRVLQETLGISEAHGGLLYLLDADSGSLQPQGLFLGGTQHSLEAHRIPSYERHDSRMPAWLRQPANGGTSTVTALGFDQAGDFRSLLHTLDSPRVNLVVVGLHNRRGETLGVLMLLDRDTGEASAMQRPERIALVEAVSGVAALCIDSQGLLEKQKKLLDAFIQLIAGAIDAKSPYTGGHCQRVPELTLMLARAAADSDTPEFSDYRPSDEDWEALHTAAWLHDCGKITTPEYVVDKATKLETLCDRIHEVRTRFEVLKRDAWIAYWQGRAEGGSATELAARRDGQLQTLDEEFTFVAHCNLGGETMATADLQRLQAIATRRWTRTLDDRLGLSWEETQRQARTPAPPLPVEEPLLADRVAHLIERRDSERMPADNPWGFKLNEPQYRFNRGELYNLSVARGTLTSEERFMINDHMVQTIRMLSRLPFPPHLKAVAEIAGGHHEKMDGSGYPKGLTREQMSLPARMMAIADIFEALTAVDRPYKKGKTLSEALGIMADMCRNAHIDPPLFALFIQAGLPRRYALRFLAAEQLDALDLDALLARAGLTDRSAQANAAP